MKAVVIERLGGPEVLEIKEVPKPSIEPGEVSQPAQYIVARGKAVLCLTALSLS